MLRGTLGCLILLAGTALVVGVAKRKHLETLQQTMREYQTMPSWSPFLNVRDALPDVGDLVPLSSALRYSTIQPNEFIEG